jgi:plastocyanin
MQHRLFTLALVVALALGLAACGSDSSDNAGTDSPAVANAGIVTIEGFTFTADPVKAGATVTVANDDSTTHSVVSDDADLFATGADLAAGTIGTFVAPEETGSYPFHCGIHSTMTATLVVE